MRGAIVYRLHIEGAFRKSLLGEHGVQHRDVGGHIEGEVLVRVVEELLESAVQHVQRMLDLAARAGDVLALNGLLLQPVVGIEQLHRGGQVVRGQAVEPGDDGRLFLGTGENAATTS